MRVGRRAIPDDADFASAAAFGVTYRTAYHALRSIADVAQGDWVVVLGAAGGVGLAAVDLAVAMKARVLAAASSPEKLELCRQRGAEATVDYDREDLQDPHPRTHRRQRPRGARPGRRTVRGAGAAGAGPRRHLRHAGLRRRHDPGHPAESRSAQRTSCVRGMEIRTFMTDRPDDAVRDMQELAQMFADGHGPAVHRRAVPAGRDGGGVAACGRPQGARQGGHRRRVTALCCHGVTMLKFGSGRSSTPSSFCSAAWSPDSSKPG